LSATFLVRLPMKTAFEVPNGMAGITLHAAGLMF
jgi:hypothetical protein